MPDRYLIGIVRDEFNGMKEVWSSTNRFRSERKLPHDLPFLFGNWIPERVMAEVPLYLSDEHVISRKFSEDYGKLPKELTDILHLGLLRTSGAESTEYSVLMSATINSPPEGRTGILLYRGKPLVVNIEGSDFAVEIKGVGSPDGNNEQTKEMIRGGYFGQSVKRYGSATQSEGDREFSNLNLQRGTQTFLSGESVRSAALFIYKNEVEYGYESERQDQAYLIRLTPGNIRSSYNQNPDFPRFENPNLVLTTAIGRQYAELASLEQTLLHSTIHPENMVRTGKGYVLTDFADCRRLDQIDNPHDFIARTLNRIKELPGITEAAENDFYSTVAGGLGVEWNPQEGYQGFIDSIWSVFFAPRVYSLWRGREDHVREETDAHKEILQLREKRCELSYIDLEMAMNFLGREINLLKHINDPAAGESLRIAQERFSYLNAQLADPEDINKKFRQDPETFYGLFFLPYMEK